MILTDHVDHRPFPLPDAPWLMHQAWNDFLFMHWRVDPAVVRTLVPEPLELHLHDGDCWVGIIPFHMSDVRPRGTLNVPGISAFPELNVRTYVIVDGKPGVWFLSLDAHQRLAVETARATYDLPYYQARMSWERRGTTLHYESERTDGRAPSARYAGHHTPRGEYRMARPGTLEHWLSERYCLFTVGKDGRAKQTDVHHIPWPLRDADVTIEENTMGAAHGLDLDGLRPDHVMYSPGVDVVVWSPRQV
ncbi:MAG: DUF2071 domain-containing protein [Alphaproteobacteria bacterium]|nr:DUF2071 domain-containing protein [Alphaproteobacteria bacterium]MCB9695629.1 DUF2071 domain-containing protein [Alphaproteobacteria bacterium]